MFFYDGNLHLIREQSSVIRIWQHPSHPSGAKVVPPAVVWLLTHLFLEQRLMSALEVKEKDLNKLKAKVDALLKTNHPASDKIEVRNVSKSQPSTQRLHINVWDSSAFCHLFVHFFQAYKDTLQTQWSWLLLITKCIDVHLKENAAYNQVTEDLQASSFPPTDPSAKPHFKI